MYQQVRCGRRGKRDPEVRVYPVIAPGEALSGDDAAREAVSGAIARPECIGALGEVIRSDVTGPSAPGALTIGLGEGEKIDVERVQTAGGRLVAALHRMAVEGAEVHAGPALSDVMDPEAFGRALGTGIGLGAFVYDEFKRDARQHQGPKALTVTSDEPAVHRAIAAGLGAAESANFARRLAATPPNIATPDYIAQQVRDLARDTGLQCTVLRGDSLKRHKFVGLMNVGKGSEHEPCMVQLVYTPQSKPAATVLLVGKTITFDSGGLSLKIHDSMRHMKYDKCGGMAVLAAMHAVAKLSPRCKVIGLLPAAENAISERAYRVDDIIEYPNGVSVEVTNTDYEGRLVLADGLIHGIGKFRPDAVIDLGTLTGGIITALGQRTAGLWCSDDALRRRVRDAADRTGERVWPMPLFEEHHRAIESVHADVVNNTLSTDAQPCICAAFLSRFVPPGIPWAHLDIAGPVSVDSDTPPYAPGPTGFGTRLLGDLLGRW